MPDRAIDVVPLADCPRAVETVARWYFDEWGRDDGYTLEDIVGKVSRSMNREAPMLLLARKAGKVVGAAELKVREMEMFPEYEHWLGGVYVDEAARGEKIGSLLIDAVLARARALGVEKIYLQTEHLSGGLYNRHGFEPLHEVDRGPYRVLVMAASLGSRE